MNFQASERPNYQVIFLTNSFERMDYPTWAWVIYRLSKLNISTNELKDILKLPSEMSEEVFPCLEDLGKDLEECNEDLLGPGEGDIPIPNMHIVVTQETHDQIGKAEMVLSFLHEDIIKINLDSLKQHPDETLDTLIHTIPDDAEPLYGRRAFGERPERTPAYSQLVSQL